MSEDQFWREISTMPRAASDSDFDDLSRRLEPCGLRTLVAFDALRWGPSEQGEGELLLYVAQTAADDINKTDALEAAEERDIPLSYESGTNPASANPGDIQTACTPAS
jgi:hypothetical protein